MYYLVFLVSFPCVTLGLYYIDESVDNWVLDRRGEVTQCTLLDIERREEAAIDSEGNLTSQDYYDHHVSCPNPQVEEFTSGEPVGADGDRVDVLYDPAGRLTPRPAAAVDSPSSLLRWGVPLFTAGIVVRILSELRVSPFRTSDWG